MERLIIFANGELPSLQKARSLVQADDYIICADGGTRHALTLGVKPNLIVGDLDSADQTALEKFREEDVAIEHTKERDKAWFYTTTFAVPVPIALAGVWVARSRRRRGEAKS